MTGDTKSLPLLTGDDDAALPAGDDALRDGYVLYGPPLCRWTSTAIGIAGRRLCCPNLRPRKALLQVQKIKRQPGDPIAFSPNAPSMTGLCRRCANHRRQNKYWLSCRHRSAHGQSIRLRGDARNAAIGNGRNGHLCRRLLRRASRNN
ncbi:MAG: hypothetical protein CM15mP21_0660 [Hyphomicrobiales bacterium]|nr:MAG: hypothetical protein CM15mP21_0660 [Hyphomicrobiales bacterium]